MDGKLLRLYAVTDRSWLDGRELCEDLEKALRGGVTMVQLREKNMDFDELVKEARKVKRLCDKYNVPLIINDSAYAAYEAGADGVHIGQDDMSVAEARKILGDDKIIGVTARTVEEAKKAEREGADYLGSGAIFGTTTKGNAKKMDFETLRSITASVSIPVVAIGGITGENILKLRGCGAAGAAVVSGIFAQADTEAAARDLYKKAGDII